MACDDVQLGDGVLFKITAVDCNGNATSISGATNLSITFWRPEDTSFSKTANFTTNGVDGDFQTVASGDACGTWRLQGSMRLNGRVLHTAIGRFRVKDNL